MIDTIAIPRDTARAATAIMAKIHARKSVMHFETPKPMTKRAKRRARGHA